MTEEEIELEEEIRRCPEIVQNHIKALKDAYGIAVDEIIRLKRVIEDEVKRQSDLIVVNYDAEVGSQIDFKGMTTEVQLRPRQMHFYLARPLGGWSDDYREAFGKMIVKSVADKVRRDVMVSIWGCHDADA